MRTRGIIGKRIARIDQSRAHNEQTNRVEVFIDRIVLEDGTILAPSISEWPGDYSVDFLVIKPKRGAR